MVSKVEEWRVRVVNATVRILKQDDTGKLTPDGQGVLVPGGLVLTAAHCIGWPSTGYIALMDPLLESIQPRDQQEFRLSPYVVERIMDIAALGEPDYELFGDDADAFEAWRASVDPVPIRTAPFALGRPVPVHILAHTGAWIRGTATMSPPPVGQIGLQAEQPVLRGTSGGPVVDDSGALVGVVSWSTEAKGGSCEGTIPLVPHALPGWIWATITAEKQKAGD